MCRIQAGTEAEAHQYSVQQEAKVVLSHKRPKRLLGERLACFVEDVASPGLVSGITICQGYGLLVSRVLSHCAWRVGQGSGHGDKNRRGRGRQHEALGSEFGSRRLQWVSRPNSRPWDHQMRVRFLVGVGGRVNKC